LRRNLLLVLLSAVLAAGLFPPWEFWPLAFVALVPLLLALRRTVTWRASGYLALLWGVVFQMAALYWMTTIFGAACLPLFVLLALPWVAFGVIYRLLPRRLALPLLVLAVPVLWVAAEWVRCEGTYMRFSWLQMGLSLVPTRGGLFLDSLIGVYGATFLVLLVNGALAALLSGELSGRRKLAAMGATTVASGGMLLALSLASPGKDKPSSSVVLVQEDNGDLDDLRRLILRYADEHPALIVCPELALHDYLLEPPALCRQLADLARATGSTLIVGAKEAAPDDAPCDSLRRRAMLSLEGRLYYNAAFLISPQGELLGVYHKHYPIQFFSDGVPGRGYPTFPTPAGRLGVAICYDFDYATTARQLVRHGAQLLVVPTYDDRAWTGLQALQHARVVQARAAEAGRWVLRPTSSGLTEVIAPTGEVTGSLSSGEPGALLTRVALREDLTPYVRAGWLLPYLCLALAAGMVVALGAGRVVRRRSPLSPAPQGRGERGRG
jgi:apolipoprotein N-acyltransferase